MNDIRMIAMDMDGTLLQRDGTILPETLEALRTASNMGIELVLASGRYPENAALTFLDYSLKGAVIGSNGAIIQDSPMGQTLFLHLIRQGTLENALRYLDSMNTRYILFSPKMVTTSHIGMMHHSEINHGPRIRKIGHVTFDHGPEAVKRAICYGVSKVFVPEQPNLAEIGKGLSGISGLLITRSNEHNIELMPEGIHKGHGIMELANWMGISLRSVMAFGDEENDLPMLTGVGFGIAMGNAPQHVKDQCRFITERYDANGIACAIEKYILRKGG